jgi:hypothetical protein
MSRLARDHDGKAGIYGVVLVEGIIRQGDEIALGNALIRPISARSSVVEQRVTQDITPSFCRVEAGTARHFCENLTTNCGSAPRRGCRRLSIYDSSNEKKK